MIVVRVELHSAITGERKELARMVIDNIGGSNVLGDYRVRTLRGISRRALNINAAWKLQHITRESSVIGHPRLRDHVWHLVAKALKAVHYG